MTDGTAATEKSGQHVPGVLRGEEVKEKEGSEPGRTDSGYSSAPSHRPEGTSTARDSSGIDPQDPIDPASPTNG